MRKRICPICGKQLLKQGTYCECGYHEILDDDELWKRIKYYKTMSQLCMFFIVPGLIAAVIGGLTFNSGVVSILTCLGGFVIAFAGIVVQSSMKQQNRQLINDQLQEFFQEEYKRLLGPCQWLRETSSIREAVERTGLYDNWSDFSAQQAVKGNYKGMLYQAANVRLTRTEERVKENEDGGKETEQVTVDVFGGIWIQVFQSKHMKYPVRVKERDLKRNGKYKEKELRGNVEVENAAFNEKYAITSDSQQAAFYVLTPQLMEQLEALDARADGRTSVAFVDDGIFFGLETRHKLTEVSIEGMSVNDIKDSYRRSLTYQADLLDIIGRNSFIRRNSTV